MLRHSLTLAIGALMLSTAAQAVPVFFNDRTAFNTAVAAAGGTLSSESFEVAFAANAVDFGAFTLSKLPSGIVFDTGLAAVVTDGTRAAAMPIGDSGDELQFAFDFPINAFGADIALDTEDAQQVTVGGDIATSFGPLVDNTPVFFGVIDLATSFTTLRFGADADFITADLAVWAAIPAPATLALLGAGLGALAWRRRLPGG